MMTSIHETEIEKSGRNRVEMVKMVEIKKVKKWSK